jgi:hypothetical protein
MRKSFLRLLSVLCLLAIPAITRGEAPPSVEVGDADQLVKALANARPGTVITLRPGIYPVRRLEIDARGEPGRPITLRAPKLGDARLTTSDLEVFVLRAPYWIIENLEIDGIGPDTDHAFHILGGADRTIIRHNGIRDFNAAVKGNVRDGRFANDVLIENNLIRNSAARDTAAPVTPLDIDGGRRWDVRGNFIADFSKSGGSQISFGAFMKAGSSDGVFERNLVICEWKTKGFTRVGLSFGGGGGEGPEICEDRNCSPKHSNGIIRNNIILNCPADFGIYVNTSYNIKIFNNTLINTGGIDVRFPESSAEIRNNIISGRARERDGAQLVQATNLFVPAIDDLRNLFANVQTGDFRLRDGSQIVKRGPALAEVTDDFCGHARAHDNVDLGAIAYGGPECERMKQMLDEAAK